MTDWNDFTSKAKQAMQLAKTKPGRYGGRYITRHYDKKTKQDVISIHDDDDPETLPEELDALAHARPDGISGIGRMRHFINSDGTVRIE